MSTNPTWYDLLDVDRTASGGEIRAAWKAAIDGLDPTDRRFRTLSDAAAVLLDPAARAEYDASLPAPDVPVTVRVPDEHVHALAGAATPAGKPATKAPRWFGRSGRAEKAETAERADTSDSGSATQPPGADDRDLAVPTSTTPRVPLVAGRWLVVLGVLAAITGTAAVVSLARDHGAGTVTVANSNDSVNGANRNQPLNHDYVTDLEPGAAAALQAAKTAVVPVLSYDYRHMAASRQRAEAYMTDAYRQTYDQLFALLQQNAPSTRTIVHTNAPIDAGVTLVSPDRVQVLVFVDRPTTNKLHTTPIEYQDYVTITMANVDGNWLVDGMATTPAS